MNQSLIEAIIISVASSSVLVEVIRWIRDAVQKKDDNNSAINEVLVELKCAICELLHDRILHICDKYIKNEGIPYLQLQSLMRLYSRYCDLSCCSDEEDALEQMVENVKELPIK